MDWKNGIWNFEVLAGRWSGYIEGLTGTPWGSELLDAHPEWEGDRAKRVFEGWDIGRQEAVQPFT